MTDGRELFRCITWKQFADRDPGYVYFLTSSSRIVMESKYYTNLRDARPKDRRRHAMETKIPFIPADDRLLIEPDPVTETYGSMGIVIPDNAREMPQIGTVRAVGPGRYTETADYIEQRYSVGQRVLLSKFSGSMINFFGKEYRICQQAEIMGEIVELEKEPEAPIETTELAFDKDFDVKAFAELRKTEGEY